MDLESFIARLRGGENAQFPAEATSLAFAQALDGQDGLRGLRDEFILPTRGSRKKRRLDGKMPEQTPSTAETVHVSRDDDGVADERQALYFVGNSLGAQPRAVRRYIDAHLETWASLGVYGHFTDLEASPLVQWQDMADMCARQSASLVGARAHEVVVMNTLTVNLHVLMAAFYRPTAQRYKVILEARPFPSDHYAIESHVSWRGFDAKDAMVHICPDDGSEAGGVISTERILKLIDDHAHDAALILLPGIQYYSGQLFDMALITAHAHKRGLVVGWDLAHAAGNVELRLHDWDVDFACWCTYKYMNAGPGAISGAFVHERHGGVCWTTQPDDASPADKDPADAKRAKPNVTVTNGSHPLESGPFGHGRPSYMPRLAGWYGGDKRVRFAMDTLYVPTPGASGFQLSNPSALDLAALSGALSVFDQTSMRALRDKSLVLTAYAEHLLLQMLRDDGNTAASPLFRIITPSDPAQRGCQLSVLLRHDALLDPVSEALERAGAFCDRRRPGVLRVAPVPLYCSFTDVWRFLRVLRGALGLTADAVA
ncbi:hypothetical protein CDD82_6120 [Ophiocordyceps australis]|uniref:Kynureninase n=1 Tax=Ophiocordyceps australis TaxID=1399860 RepID=A0A2C5YXX7_9HYPO|nr:hypothetical protein CDD82_6120 [Ophiocordyceps australis]